MFKAITAVSAELLNFIEAVQLYFSKRAISSPLGNVTELFGHQTMPLPP
jgi:hypothetical protein